MKKIIRQHEGIGWVALALLVVAIASLSHVAPPAEAETGWNQILVTQVSQTAILNPPRRSVALCNTGLVVAYFRLFSGAEVPGPASTASSQLASGQCLTFTKTQLDMAEYSSVSLVADTGNTTTVNIYSD